jgi:hypothetical protein
LQDQQRELEAVKQEKIKMERELTRQATYFLSEKTEVFSCLKISLPEIYI